MRFAFQVVESRTGTASAGAYREDAEHRRPFGLSPVHTFEHIALHRRLWPGELPQR
jgi:hypothetical protein